MEILILSITTKLKVMLLTPLQVIKSQDASIQTASIYDWYWMSYLSSKGYPGYVDKETDCRYYEHATIYIVTWSFSQYKMIC